MPYPDQTGQNGDEPTILMPEKMLDQARGCPRTRRYRQVGPLRQRPAISRPAISRISTQAPGICIPGIAATTATAPS